MTTAHPGSSKIGIEYPQTDSSEATKESKSGQQIRMPSMKGVKGKYFRPSGSPAEAPIIKDNQASTNSNAAVALLQKENGTLLGLLHAKNEEIQMLTNMLTQNKAQQGAENEYLKKENLELRNRLADNSNFAIGLFDEAMTRLKADFLLQIETSTQDILTTK